MGVGAGLLRRWPLTGSRSWSSAEMATKPKTELVFGGGWRRSPSRSSSSAVDGDSQKVGDGDEAQVGARLRRWMATKRKGTKPARMGEENPREIRVDRCNTRQIFISGLAKDTTSATFNKHFGSYGKITGSVIVKDRYSGQLRGFGFVTYADPSVVDKVFEDNHIINGKQVKIKRNIPKGFRQSKDFKTKKIFVGGVPSSVTEDEFKKFFSKYGEVVEHQIIRDHETNRSQGFGFIVFDSEEVVDEILSNGNMIDMAGTQVTLVPWFSRNQDVCVFTFVQVNVKIKKAEPKKALNPPPAPAYGSNSRARSFDGGFGGYGSSYGYDGGFVPGPYRTPGSLGGGFGAYGGYDSGGSEFGGYGGFGSSGLGGYRGGSSLGYSSGFGPYGGGFSGGYGGSGLGGYGRGEDYSSYGGSSYEWLRLQFWF